jgi:hypothetical protein
MDTPNRGFGQNQKSVLFAFTNAKVGLVKGPL